MCRGLCTEMSKYTKDEILYITAFADCCSKSVVTRLPYKIAVDIALNIKDKEVRERILDLYKIASQRSKLFNDYLQEGLKSL